MSSKQTADIVVSLPVAGQTLQEGDDIKVYEYVIRKKTTCKDLKSILSSYGQGSSGLKREELIAKVEEFAQKKERWPSLFRGERKRKRGNVSGTRANRHSAKRRARQFPEKNQPTEYVYRHEVSSRPIKSISAEAAADIYRMVDDILREDTLPVAASAAGPSNDSCLRQVTADSEDPILQSSQRSETSQGKQVVTYKDVVERNVLRRLDGMESQMRGIFGLVSNFANGQATSGVPASQTNRPPVTSPSTTGGPSHVQQTGDVLRTTAGRHIPSMASSRVEPAIEPQRLPPSPSRIPKEYKLTLVIDGRQLTYDARLVPDPPVQHFSKNLDLLFQHWTASTILSIDGDGIPLRYWPDVYKGLGRIGVKRKAWEAIKVEWGNWKFIVEAKDSFESTEAFWKEFQDKNGSPLGFQGILDVLKAKREETDAVDALAAKTFFGGDLDHPNANGAFRYLKSGQSFLMSKSSVIAKKWRMLLDTDAAVRQQFLQTSQGSGIQ